MTPKPRPPGPWRSMPPRLAYVWLRGLIGQREPDPKRIVFVSAALIAKCRRHLKAARPLRGVGAQSGQHWKAWRIDGHRVVGDPVLWDRAVFSIPLEPEAIPCFRIIP